MMHVLFVFGKTRVAPTKVLRGEQQRTFVATWVCENLELTTVDERHYVPSAHNPVDAKTRELSATAFLNSSWQTGLFKSIRVPRQTLRKFLSENKVQQKLWFHWS